MYICEQLEKIVVPLVAVAVVMVMVMVMVIVVVIVMVIVVMVVVIVVVVGVASHCRAAYYTYKYFTTHLQPYGSLWKAKSCLHNTAYNFTSSGARLSILLCFLSP